MDSIPADLSPVYLCRTCGRGFFSKEHALRCERSTETPLAEVGDIILLQRGYAWFDGDPAWVIQRGGYKFHEMRTHVFWHVVTAIEPRPARPRPLFGDPDAHQLRYHVATLAMVSQATGGWTHPKTHTWHDGTDRRPSRAVIEQAATLIGRKFEHLL